MNTLFSFIEEKLAPPLNKMSQQHHLGAIRDGMMVTVPLTIVGSMFILIANLPIGPWKNFIEPYVPILGTMSTVTIGVLAIVAAGTVAYYSAKNYGINKLNPTVIAFISISAFLLTTINDEFGFDTSLFGTKGVFGAIIIALLTAAIMKFFVVKDFVIKFPDTVPPMVSSSFMSLIPGAVTLVLIWFVSFILKLNINDLLTQVFSPLVFALNTLPGFLVFMFVRSMLWSVGIHGGAVLSIADPIFLTMFGANLEAFQAGALPPYITAQGFTMFVFLGGGGATLPLVLLMMRSKDKGFKALGRLAFPASLFEINEPVVFGVPLVMNPLMMIPYTLTTLTLSAGSYALMYFNIIGRPVANIPWTTPPIFSHYLVTGGDYKAAIWGVISLLIAGAIYYPFFKAMEKQRLEESSEV